MRLAPRQSANRRIRAAVENLESRQLLTAYFVDTDVALSAINSRNLAAGDVVLLKGGTTFNTQLYLDAGDKGTATNPITVTSYDPATRQRLADTAPAGARATIKSSSGDAVFLWNVSGLTIENINVAGNGTASSSGTGIQYWADTAAFNLTIRNVDAFNFREYGILIGAGGAGSLTNVTLTGINAYGNGDGIGTYAQGGKLIRNVYLGYSRAHDNPGLAGASNPTGGGIELGGVDGAVVEFNEAYRNGAAVSGPAGLGIWAYDSNNVLFQYNESHHNTTQERDGGGFDFDGGVTNSVMQFNYSHDNAGSGYGLYQYADAPTWTNNVVRNNVSVNDGLKNGYAAIDLWTANRPMTNVRIENNQVIKADGKFLAVSDPKLITGVALVGNVFATSGTPNLAGIGLNGPAAAPQPVPAPVTTDTENTKPATTTSPTTDASVGTTETATPTVTATTTETTRKKRGRHARR